VHFFKICKLTIVRGNVMQVAKCRVLFDGMFFFNKPLNDLCLPCEEAPVCVHINISESVKNFAVDPSFVLTFVLIH